MSCLLCWDLEVPHWVFPCRDFPLLPMSGSSFAAAFSALSLAVCLSISFLVRGCTGEKVGCLDWTGVGVSLLSKNLPVVSLLVSSVVESDGGRRVDRKSTRLNSSHRIASRMPSSA